ncbi:Sucrose transport protein SUT5 [Phytophthora nicotianae]|uniref:cGMP-dependent protein kinase n=1 Tax=Phytophthora nicotianae TaxID=4792 RepID=A0A0W8DES9_PHYNI|nr:Sucrose transport protein SUT5 [Phytophthora nicotianae]
MGAAASASPRENESDMTPRTAGDLALFGAIQREYDQMAIENLGNEVIFERMKQICKTAYAPRDPNAPRSTPAIGRGLHRRASDPHRKKREVVYSKGLDMTRDVLPKRQSESKTPECAAMLKKALQCVLFTDSSDEEMDRLLFLMKRIKVEAEQNVIKQGDLGDQFYVVHSGSLEVIVNTAVLGYLKPGDHFGELALIYDDGEMIIKQGDVGDTFFIVEEGNVSCQMEGPRGFKNSDAMRTELAILGPGDYFGEMALLSDMPRNASIYAKGSVKCLSLGRQEFDSILGPLTDVLDRNSRIRILRTIPAFATKSQEALEYAVSQLEIKAYQDSQCIFRQGDIAVAFYIVKSGCVKLIKKRQDGNNNLVTEEVLLKANDTFGGEVFEQADTYTCTVISAGRSQCQRLKVSSLARSGSRQFTQVIPARISDEGAKSRLTFCIFVLVFQRVNMGEHGRMKSCTLALDDIQVAGVLGEGSFGKVVMVHALVDGAEEQPMALKIMAKSHIIESDQQVQVMREKQVLMTIPKHPFIVDLYATYQDANNLYMLMELVQGGELFTLLHNEEFIETVDESSVRFYSANALLGLQHMHRYDYAYRDLKPENLLISREGYLKFVDFGFAKKIPFTVINSDGNEEVHSRTFTLCGTLEYLAPEFVLNTGHDIAVDYWALGILIYEMLVGYTPFGTGDGDTTTVPQHPMIRTGANSVDFPFHLQENCPHACDLVRRLLQGDPTKRIGVGINGDQELRQHPWFSRIEWDKLYSMSLEPPYLPPSAASMTSHCSKVKSETEPEIELLTAKEMNTLSASKPTPLPRLVCARANE